MCVQHFDYNQLYCSVCFSQSCIYKMSIENCKILTSNSSPFKNQTFITKVGLMGFFQKRYDNKILQYYTMRCVKNKKLVLKPKALAYSNHSRLKELVNSKLFRFLLGKLQYRITCVVFDTKTNNLNENLMCQMIPTKSYLLIIISIVAFLFYNCSL